MKKSNQTRQKLLLSKESLRRLSAKDLRQVMGASDTCTGPTADCTYECN
jgi:hypothetical protein